MNIFISYIVQAKGREHIFQKENLSLSICTCHDNDCLLFSVLYKKREANERSKWSKITKWGYFIESIIRYWIIYFTHKMMKAQMKVFKTGFWYRIPLMFWSTQ